jgi:hypothetical protein
MKIQVECHSAYKSNERPIKFWIDEKVFLSRRLRGAVYSAYCSMSANLAGRTGPPLTGDDFLLNWDTQPLLELANKIFRPCRKMTRTR